MFRALAARVEAAPTHAFPARVTAYSQHPGARALDAAVPHMAPFSLPSLALLRRVI